MSDDLIPKPIIPTPEKTVQTARDTFAALRPRPNTDPVLRRELYTGRYGDVFYGWGAQARLNRDRLASEVVATRLPLAEGDELRDLVHSEFWAEIDETPGNAIADIALSRTIVSTSPDPPFSIGVIPAGTRFRKVPDQQASPPIAEAFYATSIATPIDGLSNLSTTDLGGGQWRHDQAFILRAVATAPGLGTNTPFPLTFAIVDPLFDPLLVVQPACRAAGGVDGLADDTVRSIGRANYLGQFGPTEGALVAKALGTLGVQHLAIAEDPVLARTVLYAADGSWACGTSFLKAVQQALRDGPCGFGCRVDTGFVTNVAITVSAVVTLDNAASRSDTTEITQAVQKRLRSYFDDRPDWPTFRLTSIGAAIAGAHPKILSCDSPQVLVNGVAQPEPAQMPPLGAPSFVTHWYLADDAVSLTFLSPT